MLVALDDDGVAVNDVVAVRFELPGGFEVNAEAEVARVIRGRRDQDVCMAAGLAFTRLPMNARHEILVRLAGTPPPVPGRSLRLGVAPLAVRTPKGPFSAAGGPARRS